MPPTPAPAGPSGTSTVSDGQLDRPAALAFVTDEASEAALRGGLTEFLGSLQIRRGGVRSAARALEQEPSPRVLIVDVSGHDDPIGHARRLGRRLRARHQGRSVIGDRTRHRVLPRGHPPSRRERIPAKPLTRRRRLTLRRTLYRGCRARPGEQAGGRVVVVCGARGGVGVTTVAANLALQLSDQTRGHVALVDLHLRGGHAAMLMGIPPSAGLRMALEEPDRADALLLERIAMPSATGCASSRPRNPSVPTRADRRRRPAAAGAAAPALQRHRDGPADAALAGRAPGGAARPPRAGLVFGPDPAASAMRSRRGRWSPRWSAPAAP